MIARFTRAAAELAVRAFVFRHIWRDAVLADRVAYSVIGVHVGIAILLIAGCFPG
jgi:hypothetical protein